MEPTELEDGADDSTKCLDEDVCWFLGVGEAAGSNWDTEEISGVDGSECGSLVNVDLDSDVVEPVEEVSQAYFEETNEIRTEALPVMAPTLVESHARGGRALYQLFQSAFGHY
jgi:hypothetical protein